jgi:hypothetical protein
MCIGMSLELFWVWKSHLWGWLIGNKLASFIKFGHFINILNSWLYRSSKMDVRHCVLNTRLWHLWKMPMFDMLQFNVGGIPLGLLVKVWFTSSIIVEHLAFPCETMGRIHAICKSSHQYFVNSKVHNSHVMWFFNLTSSFQHVCKSSQ